MDEAEREPLRDEASLSPDYAFEQPTVGMRRLRGFGVMAGEGVVGEDTYAFGVAAGGEVLEGADAGVAGGDAGEDCAGLDGLAHDALAGGDGGERAGGGHAERGHGFADEVLAQDGAEGGTAVAAAGERRGAGAFELNIVARAVAGEDFAEQVGAAVAKLRDEVAELMTGIGFGQRLGPFGNAVAGEDGDAFLTGKGFGRG